MTVTVNDEFYGADAELRIGLMADAVTDPTSWQRLEFMSLTAAASTERRTRAKLGALTRNNPLDPTKPRKGFSRVAMDIVLDADTLQLPLWLRHTLGAPTTSGPASGIYTHLWASGGKAVQYCAIQVRPDPSSKVYVYRGLTLDALSASYTGENTQDFDLSVALKGLNRQRVSTWLTGSVTAVPAEAPVYRAVHRIDGVAPGNVLQGAWSWNRNIGEEIFASTTAAPVGLKPGEATHAGSAKYRALASAVEDYEEADTTFAPDHQLLGVAAGHQIVLLHPLAEANPAPLVIAGPGLIERDYSWSPHQDATNPAAKISVLNGSVSYP